MHPPLLNYIREQIANGFSRDAIRTSLLQSGWAEHDLVEAFANAFSSPIPVKKISPPKLESGKLPLAGMVVFSSLMYLLWQHLPADERQTATNTKSISNTPAVASTSVAELATTTPVNIATSTTKVAQKTAGQYADGTYTGTPADAFYGTVQIQAIITGGKITAVKFLRYPNDRSASIAVNSEAMPTLIQEAIVAQSAKVDGASGATFTSQAFKQSLASALMQAKN